MSQTENAGVKQHPLAGLCIVAIGALVVYLATSSSSKPLSNAEFSNSQLQDLRKEVDAWQCVKPVGTESMRPLFNLNIADTVRILEAEERIELANRREKRGWNDAASSFATEQYDFGGSFNYVPEYQNRARDGVRMALEGIFPFGGTPASYVRDLKAQFDKVCGSRNSYLVRMKEDEGALTTIRAEGAKKWLKKQNRLPCVVAAVQNCKP